MLLTFFHKSNHQQSVEYLRAIEQSKYVALGLRTILRSIEHHFVLG